MHISIYIISILTKKKFFTLIGFLCVQLSDYRGVGTAQFFSTISMIAFWFSGVLLVLYLFHVIYVLSKVPWIKIEFFFCVGAALLLGLASALIIGRGGGLLIAAGVSIQQQQNLMITSQFHTINFYRNAGNCWKKKLLSLCFVFTFTVFRICGDVCLRV